MRYSFPVLVILLCLPLACNHKCTDSLELPRSHFFSFENDMEGWGAKGTDLELGDSLIDWSIERSQEQAKDGNTAVRLFLANYNDQGKIWIERGFGVKPNHLYQVNVRYAFCSADYGMANLWTIITGVVAEPVQGRAGLVYQGHTGNGSETDIGFKWLAKSYDFDVKSGPEGMLYVDIGVWGTWETPRTYYVDSVSVVFTDKE
jgi:hypothetical protein